jgi:hypothetical protein
MVRERLIENLRAQNPTATARFFFLCRPTTADIFRHRTANSPLLIIGTVWNTINDQLLDKQLYWRSQLFFQTSVLLQTRSRLRCCYLFFRTRCSLSFSPHIHTQLLLYGVVALDGMGPQRARGRTCGCCGFTSLLKVMGQSGITASILLGAKYYRDSTNDSRSKKFSNNSTPSI